MKAFNSSIFLVFFSFSGYSAVIDSNCSAKQCTIQLKSIQGISSVEWLYSDLINPIKSEVLKVTYDEDLEFINYSVKYIEEGRGGSFQNLKGKIRIKDVWVNGQSDIIYDGVTGAYFGIPYQSNASLIINKEYEIITDHIGLIEGNSKLLKIKRKSKAGTVFSENLSSFKVEDIGFATIRILESNFTEEKSIISGRVLTNINEKSITSIKLSINNIITPLSENHFTFETAQASIVIKAIINLNNMPSITELLILNNPLIHESTCEFDLDKNLLSVFCMSDDESVLSTTFYINEYEVGRNGVVSIIPGEMNKFSMIAELSGKKQLIYDINIDKEGYINVQKK